METVAKFYYDEREFPKIKYSFEPLGQIVDTRFNDLVDSIPTFLTNYLVMDSSNWKKKNIRSLEVLAFKGGEDESSLKDIFSSIFVNDFGIFPEGVSCKEKKHYSLINEVFKERGINKVLSSYGFLEFLFKSKIIL